MIIDLGNINKEKIAAWAVHAFTASGAVMGFLAIISIFNNDASQFSTPFRLFSSFSKLSCRFGSFIPETLNTT